ncbi:alpha/beta fold hydrolase [Georgenia alba]|uniref:Alpha/beta fold hydrolase n=1 Tax=Georgenia alba TaxID=2233858 RepID=A0ABW2Q875_9MICO
MNRTTRRPRTRVAGVLAATLAVSVLAVAPASADEPTEVSGTLDDTTPYEFLVPPDWNGTVFVDLDFAGGTVTPTHRALLEDGAAYGGTSRAVTGWDISQAIDNQVEAVHRFAAEAGEPSRVIAMGASMGGFVAAGVAQEHPEEIDGAVAMCGGLSGAVAQWNQKLDTVFVLSELTDPAGDLPVIDIPDRDAAIAAWQAHLADAQQTPEGRARIALAAAIGQLPAWSESAPRPDPRDTASYQAGWYGALSGDSLPYIGQAMSSRHTLTQVYGGNPSWNVGIDYAVQLERVSDEARAVVERLYGQAGLSLQEDLAALRDAPRISADPDALTRFARLDVTGELDVPVVTMNNIGDQISTVAQQQEYQREVREAGNARLLRQTYVASPAHCGFSDAERLAAAHLLLDRLDRGRWTGGESSEEMNRTAESFGLGAARFLTYQPDRFNRPY